MFFLIRRTIPAPGLCRGSVGDFGITVSLLKFCSCIYMQKLIIRAFPTNLLHPRKVTLKKR
jgi:hypothetical protein